MDNCNAPRLLGSETIRVYLTHLHQQERADQTVQKYTCTLRRWRHSCRGDTSPKTR